MVKWIGQGISKQLIINHGFKATLYYVIASATYVLRPEQGSFPSANKNVWKQIANPPK